MRIRRSELARIANYHGMYFNYGQYAAIFWWYIIVNIVDYEFAE